MRLIDADALIDEAIERYCENCDKRKGIKDGKWKIVYQIGGAPCRACEVDDMKCEIEDAPTIEPERKKGTWVKENVVLTSNPPQYQWYCSECGQEIHGFYDAVLSNFCPNCGADTRGTEDANG